MTTSIGTLRLRRLGGELELAAYRQLIRGRVDARVRELEELAPRIPGEHWHGTASGYRQHRCRCGECRAWSAADRATRRGLEHVRSHGYAGYCQGCRCDTCRAARAARHRREHDDRRRELEAVPS